MSDFSLFDPTTKLCKKGDKVTISYEGQPYVVECVETTVVGYERTYRMRFADGSERTMIAPELTRSLN